MHYFPYCLLFFDPKTTFEHQKIIDLKEQSLLKLQYTKIVHKNQKYVRRNA
jgi:hypothetical protein